MFIIINGFNGIYIIGLRKYRPFNKVPEQINEYLFLIETEELNCTIKPCLIKQLTKIKFLLKSSTSKQSSKIKVLFLSKDNSTSHIAITETRSPFSNVKLLCLLLKGLLCLNHYKE